LDGGGLGTFASLGWALPSGARVRLYLPQADASSSRLDSEVPGVTPFVEGPSEVPVEELMKPVGLPDLALGPADAKVTVVEYASMTCGHCAHFTTDVWPKFKEKYIDTNKVRYIFREFPLDNLAAAASMLARCTGNDKAFPLIEVLFEKQKDWAFGEGNPVPRLFEIAKQAGFTQESFDKCLTDQKLLDEITAGRTRASDVFGVSATPTFYVNGKKLDGSPTLEKLDEMITPLLAKS
jgi:protein-disulfide isomerase